MSLQQRKDEILAKKAKLAELKRTRALREQGKQHRESLGVSPEVSRAFHSIQTSTERQLVRQKDHRHREQKRARNSTTLLARSSTSLNQTEVRVERHPLQKEVARVRLAEGLPD